MGKIKQVSCQQGILTAHACKTYGSQRLFINVPSDAGNRLNWECASRTDSPIWKQFSCDWQGTPLQPGVMKLRYAKDVNEINKDWYQDSLELAEVRA